MLEAGVNRKKKFQEWQPSWVMAATIRLRSYEFGPSLVVVLQRSGHIKVATDLGSGIQAALERVDELGVFNRRPQV
jgi:hypothetical protein